MELYTKMVKDSGSKTANRNRYDSNVRKAYLEQLKQAQRDKKVRELQDAYQKFLRSKSEVEATERMMDIATPVEDFEAQFKNVLETASSGGKIELSEEMEKYIADKPFEEIEGLREKLSDRAARRWYKTQNEMIFSLF